MQLSICAHDACDGEPDQSGRTQGFSQLCLAEIQRLIRCGCVPCTQAMPWRERGDLLLPGMCGIAIIDFPAPRRGRQSHRMPSTFAPMYRKTTPGA